tara:strand:- start:80 stop:706 length:627 start_codon:yes stop_codon:yes gene_type:complete
MIRIRTTRRALAALAAGTLTLAACGDDDDAVAAPDTEPVVAETETETETTETEAETAESDPEPAEPVVVTAVDFGYEDLPDRVPAGTRLALVNESPVELHELVAFRIPDDEDRSVDELVALPPDEMMPLLGEPATVLLAAPGSDETIPAVGDGTLTEPGRYAVICVIPTGADPDEYLSAAATSDGPPEVAGGPPHAANGMYAELTVTD